MQERVAATHLRVVKVASESSFAYMLTEALGRSKIEVFCAEIGQSEPCAEKLDKESKGVKKPRKSSLRLKQLKWMKRSRTGSRTQKLQGPRTSWRMQDAKIKNDSKVEKLQWVHTTY